MKYKTLLIVTALFLGFLIPRVALSGDLSDREIATNFLQSKNSPLVSHVDTLLEQKDWRLIVAISAIESSYCKKQLGNNCWGIVSGNGSGYARYADYDHGIQAIGNLLSRRQAQGRWLTVESMDCSYVVPCNPHWVSLVKEVLIELS